MKEELIKLLEPLGYDISLQGSYNDNDEYPDTFITFWNYATEYLGYYNNEPTRAAYGYWIYLYSNDPQKVEDGVNQMLSIFEKAGWSITNVGEDMPSGVPTHTGRMIEVTTEVSL